MSLRALTQTFVAQLTQLAAAPQQLAAQVAQPAQLAPVDSFGGGLPPAAQQYVDLLKQQLADAVASGKLDVKGGSQIIYDLSRELRRQGQGQAADALLGMLGQQPWREGKVQVIGQRGGDAPVQLESNGPHQTLVDKAARQFNPTGGELLALQAARAACKARMGGVDPNDLPKVKAYFDAYSKTHTTAQTRDEFQRYADANFAYSSMSWGQADVDGRDAPAAMKGFLEGQPKDELGRTLMNCAGYSYLAGAIFKGNPKFEVHYIGSGSHVAAAVFEKGTGGRVKDGFAVNTANAANAPRPSPYVYDLSGAQPMDWHDKLRALRIPGYDRKDEHLGDRPSQAWVPGTY